MALVMRLIGLTEIRVLRIAALSRVLASLVKRIAVWCQLRSPGVNRNFSGWIDYGYSVTRQSAITRAKSLFVDFADIAESRLLYKNILAKMANVDRSAAAFRLGNPSRPENFIISRLARVYHHQNSFCVKNHWHSLGW